MNHFVSEIFAEPETWGLRGDPFLWEYLKKYYADIEIPYSIEQFSFRNTFDFSRVYRKAA